MSGRLLQAGLGIVLSRTSRTKGEDVEAGTAIYTQGSGIVLIYDGDQEGIPYGHVEEMPSGYASESMPVDQFLKHGYWDAVESASEEMV